MNTHKGSAIGISESVCGESLRSSRGTGVMRMSGVALAAALALAGCGGAGEKASKMTSFSTTESPEAKAELFSLPADQMSHIQIVPVEQGRLAHPPIDWRGRVQRFQDHPGDHAGGWPVSRVVVAPGEHVRAGQPMLYIASPDYSLLRAAYIKARDAFQLADKFYVRAQGSVSHIRPSPRPTSSKRNRTARRRRRTSNPARTPFASSAYPTRKLLCSKAPSAGNSAVLAGSRRSGGPGVLGGAIAGGRRHTVLHAVGYEFGVDSRERLSERCGRSFTLATR